MWYKLQLATLTEKETQRLGIVLSEFPPVTLNHLEERIKKIDTKYPWIINHHTVLFIPIAFIVIWVIIIVLFMCCIL